MFPEILILILMIVTPLALILPSTEFAIFTLIAMAGGLYLFVRGFHLLVRKRLLMNTPASKIRSASMGLVEVSGVATGPYTLPTPVTGVPCFLYRITAWQQDNESRNRDWRKVAEETLHVPFFLDDSTGQLLIEPTGAELDLRSDFRQTFSDTVFSNHATPGALSFLARHGIENTNKIRIEECSIPPQSPLFVVGTLGENPGVVVRPVAAPVDGGASFGRTPFRLQMSLNTPPTEVVRLSMTTVNTSSEMTQQSKIAAALSKAGITSPAAWEAAGVPYQSAQEAGPPVEEVAVHGGNAQGKSENESAFDLKPPVVLMKGENNPTFVISWRSQQDLVGSLAWKSAAMIWGGGGLILLALYVLLQQLELM